MTSHSIYGKTVWGGLVQGWGDIATLLAQHFQAPHKQLQHFEVTYRIVVQVWPPGFDLLRHVVCCKWN